jgi:hypothetical protein
VRGALAKLTWIQVTIIGIVVCAIIGASLYFLMIKKQQEVIAQRTTELQAVESKAKEKPRAEEDLAQAKAELRAARRRLAIYQRTKMIPLSLNTQVDQYHSMVRLWREQGEVLGPLMERHIASTGLEVAGTGPNVFANLVAGQRFNASTGSAVIPVPKPPETPSGITSGVYTVSLGNITARTTKGFPQVLSFLRSFTRAPRLVAVGAPTISGTSPNLTVTVPLSVYYLVEGGAPPAPAGGGGPMGMPGEPGMPPDAGAPPMEPAGPPGDMAE